MFFTKKSLAMKQIQKGATACFSTALENHVKVRPFKSLFVQWQRLTEYR
jgi:hypothetical protein